jgi:hypothetical protein
MKKWDNRTTDNRPRTTGLGVEKQKENQGGKAETLKRRKPRIVLNDVMGQR